MTEPNAKDRLRIAIDIGDPVLADRITSALKGAPELEVVGTDQQPDALIVGAGGAAADADLALTSRELEVLALLAEGASNKLIARRLGISTHTAKFHVSSLLDKLDAVSRTDALAHAIRLGVIEL